MGQHGGIYLIMGAIMNITLLKKAAVDSVLLMVSVILISCITDLFRLLNFETDDKQKGVIATDKVIYTDYKKINASIIGYASSVPDLFEKPGLTGINALKKQIDPEILQKLGSNFIMIKKPAGDSLHMTLDDLYIDKSIRLDITGIKDNTVNSDMIYRIRDNDIYVGSPAYKENTSFETDEDGQIMKEVTSRDYGGDLSHGITVNTFEDKESKLYSAQVIITLDSVYEYFIYEDENNYYIDLRKPSEIYDKIVVIDAGHGGKDSGALSRDKKYFEKDINLDILLKLKALLDKSDIKAYYTRTTDQTVYLRPRAELVNTVDADYFISIHCNANESSSPNGMEVLYYNNEFKNVRAKDLAGVFSLELEKKVNLKQKGIIERKYNDIYIMSHSLVPTVLLEIGYISNQKDLNYLIREENRDVIANAIYSGILRAYNELPAADN